MAKVRIGAIEQELVDKTKIYKKLTGTSTVELVERLLSNFFNNALLTNDYLELEEPFYFVNYSILYEDEIIKATLENPLGSVLSNHKIEPEDIYLVNKIPNNLDTFEPEFNKFCYKKNPNRHKGIYVFHNFEALSDNPEKTLVTHAIYLFDYNEAENTLNIEDITFTDNLSYIIDLSTHKKAYDSIIDELKNYDKWIFEKGLDPEDPEKICLNYVYVFSSMEVIEPYEDKVAMKNYLIETGSYNPENELKGMKTFVIKNRKLIKPTDLLKEVLKNE